MKKKILLSISIASVAVFAASIALANYGDDNSLAGKVRKEGSTKTISGAKVKLYSKTGSRVLDSDKSGSGGRYKFNDLSEKKYKVSAKKDGFRNPRNHKKDSVSKIVSVDGDTHQNLYLEPEEEDVK